MTHFNQLVHNPTPGAPLVNHMKAFYSRDRYFRMWCNERKNPFPISFAELYFFRNFSGESNDGLARDLFEELDRFLIDHEEHPILDRCGMAGSLDCIEAAAPNRRIEFIMAECSDMPALTMAKLKFPDLTVWNISGTENAK